jgi:hypothetical protein
VPADVAGNFEGLVQRYDGRLWKLVRCFDDPGVWTEPGVRQLAFSGRGGDRYRNDVLDDQWELYDLTGDPIEAVNRWADPTLDDVRRFLRTQLKQVRAASVPERHRPWPYADRHTPAKRGWLRF